MGNSAREYDQAWKRYHRLRNHTRIAFVCFALSGFLSVFLNLPRRLGWVAVVPVLASWLYGFIAIDRFKDFACPRCGKRFRDIWKPWRGTAGGVCSHCGLMKFSNPG